MASFVDMLSEIGHESPIEHATFTFGIEGVSRALLAQITRHRIASFSVQSQRYVAENAFEYVLPPEIAAIPEAKEEFIRAMEEDQRHYENLTNILAEKHKKALLEKGKDEKTAARMAQKQAIEDARFVLPNACDTKMIVTFNARSLMNFFYIALLQTRTMGNSGCCNSNAALGQTSSSAFVCQSRSQLCERRLLGRKNDLRRNQRSTCVFP